MDKVLAGLTAGELLAGVGTLGGLGAIATVIGLLTRFLSGRATHEQARDDLAAYTEILRVDELQQQIRDDRDRMDGLQDQIDETRRLADEHSEWDRDRLEDARRAGVTIPKPPPLIVPRSR